MVTIDRLCAINYIVYMINTKEIELDDFVSVAQATELLSISRETLYKYINKGLLTVYKIKGFQITLLERKELLSLERPTNGRPRLSV